MLFCNTAGRESIAQPSKAVPNTTSSATGVMALSDCMRTLGFSGVAPRSSFITPVRFRDRLHAGEGQDHADELHPKLSENSRGAARGIASFK